MDQYDEHFYSLKIRKEIVYRVVTFFPKFNVKNRQTISILIFGNKIHIFFNYENYFWPLVITTL